MRAWERKRECVCGRHGDEGEDRVLEGGREGVDGVWERMGMGVEGRGGGRSVRETHQNLLSSIAVFCVSGNSAKMALNAFLHLLLVNPMTGLINDCNTTNWTALIPRDEHPRNWHGKGQGIWSTVHLSIFFISRFNLVQGKRY